MVYPSGGGKLGCHGREGSGCEMERGEKGKGKGKGEMTWIWVSVLMDERKER